MRKPVRRMLLVGHLGDLPVGVGQAGPTGAEPTAIRVPEVMSLERHAEVRILAPDDALPATGTDGTWCPRRPRFHGRARPRVEIP